MFTALRLIRMMTSRGNDNIFQQRTESWVICKVLWDSCRTSSGYRPLVNENNGDPLVMSHGDTGNPPHMELSDNTTLPDMGLPKDPHFDTGNQVASHPSNVSNTSPAIT